MQLDELGALLPIVLIVVVFYLLILRPARRRQQAAARLQGGLNVGDRVMLTSGVFGTVSGLADETFDIEVATGVVLTVHRQAVAKVVEPAPEHGSGAVDEADTDDEQGEPRRTDHGGEARP